MTTLKPALDTQWTIDPAHSEISFKVKHLMISNVKGSFSIFDATIHTHGKDFTTAEIDLWIEADSINTGDEKRDDHLKGPEFFDTAKYKQITFVSSSMARPDTKGNIELWGELTMKNITQNIKLDVQFGGVIKDPWGNEKAGFTITGKINRTEFDLRTNMVLETGGVLVGEEVTISCEVELINTSQKDQEMKLDSTVPEIVVGKK